ncbi:hypothetical protein [Stappia sp. ES.058]|uniref:hypothetical protein n=1 Tax=Stappia sp. ES.058 TaxID=1881061 RepID=UPI00087C0587|nr:hypothetical protein [Stappia sp. ES.058]SDU44003.1 hypothetical protein SAMN05428979_3835 [Stappia sp. ES.058]
MPHRNGGCDPHSGLTWRHRPARPDAGHGESVLVVVFSQARVAEERFGLERLFAQTRHACLFLKGPDADWYRTCGSAIDFAIAEACSRASPDRIVYYGASKGAYGALLTGLKRGDGEIYAFGPEFRLGEPGTQSRLYMQEDPTAPDPLSMLQACQDGPPVHIVFGIFDAIDARGATRCLRADLPARTSLSTLRSSHASHDHLYTLNIIRKLITRFDRDLGGLCAERNLIARDAVEDIERFARAGAARARGMPVDVSPMASDPYVDQNPGFALLAAEALVATECFDQAEALLAGTQTTIDSDAALSGLPKRWRKSVWRTRLAARAAAGDDQGLANLLQEVRVRFPEDTALAREYRRTRNV